MAYDFAAYYQKNKERIKLRMKNYYEQNRDARLEYAKRYYENNTDKFSRRLRGSVAKNPDKYRAIHASAMSRRRARLRGAKSEKYNRNDIYNIYGGFCIVCDSPINKDIKFPHRQSYTIHHIVPISKGGDDIISNVAPAHFGCNRMVGNKTPIAVRPRYV